MDTLRERLSNILKSDLSPQCSSAAYAIMINGEITAEDSMGRNPIRGGTYNVGSVSKVYCAAAVMQLVEKGLLDLDRPVCHWLPRFTMPDERYKKITLRHCLSHSCGLPGTQWRWLAAGSPRQEDYYEEVYRYLEHSALHSDPGAFSVYCNDGFTLAEMAVAEVTGMTYGEYCKKYITEPIGAYSSRLSSQRNPAYEHTHMTGMPVENIGPEGAGGIGTTMSDLCRFGQLFLDKNEVISEESKKEINSPQGTTFLEEDGWSGSFGLGWDCVDMPHDDYLLGSGVLDKGGGTREFSSRLLVIPKYNAVLAISATVDCGIDVKEEILQLFAAAMLEKGVNILKNYQPVPPEVKEKYEGLYLASGKFYRVCIEGVRADIYEENSRGGKNKLYGNLKYNGSSLEWKPNYQFSFLEQDGKRYLMGKVYNRYYACGVRASDIHCPPLPEKWKKRIGKSYVISNIFPDDLIGNSQLNAFTLHSIPEVPGALLASFTLEANADGGTYFEAVLSPYINGKASDCLACGAILLPYHAGRDLLNLCFEEKDGIEYCECSGYIYRDVSSLEKYCGQGFAECGANHVYVMEQKPERLPEIPEGRRVILLNESFSAVYDSLLDEQFTHAERGYILLI